MFIRIDKASEEPLYLQIRAQIIAAMAREVIMPGDSLPSVRSLASELGVNLHTVNKAYAVLRDEGYLVMRGRSGAVIVDPADEMSPRQVEEASQQMEEALHSLALAHRARGGTAEEFKAAVDKAVAQAYGKDM